MGSALERHVRLEPVPESARVARRAVSEVLDEVGCFDLVEPASLLVSELVTNAILHARTSIELFVAASPAGLRVGVNDRSPHLPVRRDYGRAATTGRGLEMVDLVAKEHGIDVHDDGSKTVWFELGAPDPGAEHTELHQDTPTSRHMDLVLLGTPRRLARAWQQHADALLRESLLACWDVDGDIDAPLDELNRAGEAFTQLVAGLDPAANGATGGAGRVRDASTPAYSDRSTPAHADLVIVVSTEAVAMFDDLGRSLERSAELAEAGALLAPPTQPEIRQFRRWVCEQVRVQSAGGTPSPWSGLDSDTAATTRPVDWDSTAVTTSAQALVAADDANRIIAVSDPALVLLGWAEQDLVGQRIVSIVPPHLREAHVAAFTDLLLTGATTILDRHVQVPALHRDGSEILVDLHVTRGPAAGGRTVFVAALTPLEG